MHSVAVKCRETRSLRAVVALDYLKVVHKRRHDDVLEAVRKEVRDEGCRIDTGRGLHHPLELDVLRALCGVHLLSIASAAYGLMCLLACSCVCNAGWSRPKAMQAHAASAYCAGCKRKVSVRACAAASLRKLHGSASSHAAELWLRALCKQHRPAHGSSAHRHLVSWRSASRCKNLLPSTLTWLLLAMGLLSCAAASLKQSSEANMAFTGGFFFIAGSQLFWVSPKLTRCNGDAQRRGYSTL